MKKISSIGKPYFLVVFGVLLLLFYLNGLTNGGSLLALAIIGIIVAAYYIASGVLNIIFGDKFPENEKKLFGLIDISAFPVLMFVYYLITVINANSAFGPTSWVIAIIGLAASIGFASLYIVNFFHKKDNLKKFSTIFAALFVLSLLLDVLFDVFGNPVNIGGINIIVTVSYIIYSYVLFNELFKA